MSDHLGRNQGSFYRTKYQGNKFVQGTSTTLK